MSSFGDIVPSGYTSLYDAILESKQYLSSSTKNFIVIISDGEDTSSTKTKKECSDFIEKCKKELVEVIYLGINIDSTEATSLGINNTFFSKEREKKLIQGFDYSDKYILSILSCARHHNIINLLKAYKILIKELDFDLKIVFVFQILDKNYFSEIKPKCFLVMPRKF